MTLIELLIAMAVAAVLTMVALPSYTSYITKQRAASGQADLLALGANLDGHLLNTTVYPAPVNGTAALRAALPGWQPTQAEHFDYELVAVDNAAFPPFYEVRAKGKTSTLASCVLQLQSSGVRTRTGCPGGSATW